ncbi:MAG: hypothetical protein MUD11_15640 [Rhodobacteraceae bacterium]|jgi:uncharacterized glyoxalase superfamily protein PhnB|nr:hypothetical protein [Paracoccaceae bacterium]
MQGVIPCLAMAGTAGAASDLVIAPCKRQFWGDDWGLLADPFDLHRGILQTPEGT